MTYLLTIYTQNKRNQYSFKMEELRTKFFNSVDLVEEQNPTVLNQLTKLELQAKLLALNIIAAESILDMLKYSKDELVEFIISLNLCYIQVEVIEQAETAVENSINAMSALIYPQFPNAKPISQTQFTQVGHYPNDNIIATPYQPQIYQMTRSYDVVPDTASQYPQNNFYPNTNDIQYYGSYNFYQYQDYQNSESYYQTALGWNEASQYEIIQTTQQ